MGNQLSEHEEVQVGGELDEARLRRIMVRGFYLRNTCVSEDEAFDFRAPHSRAPDAPAPPWSRYGGPQHADGETPVLVWNEGDGGETRMPSYELHVGCGEGCPVLAVIPWDGDSGGVSRTAAEAVVHAGRDLIDLAREVRALRRQLEEAKNGIPPDLSGYGSRETFAGYAVPGLADPDEVRGELIVTTE